MAIAYSTQYDRAFVTQVHDPARRTFARVARLEFEYTNPASGDLDAIGDLIYLVKVPAHCEIVVFDSLFRWSAWAASTTIDIGFLGYTGPDGVAVDADDNGLLDGLDVDAAGWWYAGVNHSSTDTTVHHAPIVDVYSVRANAPVTITAVFRDTAPSASDTLTGYITVLVD